MLFIRSFLDFSFSQVSGATPTTRGVNPPLLIPFYHFYIKSG